MLNRNALVLVAGAAIFALDASAASAQGSTRPTSQRRIPITKEAPGEVSTPRVDTVTVYKTDTLRLQGRIDTVMTTTTVTRVDTVTQPVAMTARRIGGMYLGLGAGGALPFGAIRTVNQPGASGQVNLGWQGLNSALGFRGDLNFTQYAKAADYAAMGSRPKVWNANLDARLDLPFFNNTLGSSVRFKPYVIGGGSWLHYNNLRMKSDRDGGFTGGVGTQSAYIASDNNAGTTGLDDSFHSDWGWNVGGGFGFHAGRKELFAEARWVHFNHGAMFGPSWHVPIVFGVNFF